MADKHSKAVRSYNMSRVKSKHTSPELLVRSKLHALGFRFRLHNKDLPGRPDIVLPKYKTAVFINGCFWHACPKCKPAMPASNVKFWKNKIEGNVQRDRRNQKALRTQGWKVLTVWQCELKKDADKIITRVAEQIKS